MSAWPPQSDDPTRPPRLLIASGNRNKLREFAELLAPARLECLGLSDLANASSGPVPPEPEETGSSFLENACLKAAFYAQTTGHWTLADDSGLVVDALEGQPGVDSAYFAARHGRGSPEDDRPTRDAANNRLLLEKLSGLPPCRRTARFVCALALATPDGRIALTTTGSVLGRIVESPRGSGGFGYDCLFEVAGHHKTSAEMTSTEKHAVSHRGIATRRFLAALAELAALGPPLASGGPPRATVASTASEPGGERR